MTGQDEGPTNSGDEDAWVGQSFYDLAPVGFCTISASGLIQQTNLTAAALLGFTRDSLIHQPFAHFIDPEDQNTFSLMHQRIMETGAPQDCELRLLRHGGTRLWARLQAIAAPAQDGAARFHIVLSDITERKKTEALLQASLRLSQYGLTHSLDEVLTKTLDEAELLTASKIGFFHFLEADQKTLWMQTWSTRTLKEMCTAEGTMRHYSVEQAGVWVDCIREHRAVIHNDYPNLPHRKGLPLGHAPVTRELVVPILRGDTIVGIIGVGNKPTDYDEKDVQTVSRLADLAWDVVATRRAEEALKQSLKLLAETERIGRVGGWELDIDTGKQTWTEEVYRIHEVDADLDPTVERGINFYVPESRPLVEEAVRKAVNHGEPFNFEADIITAKGNRRQVQAIGRPDLEHRRIYGFLQDITERKQLEEKVRQMAFYDVLTDLPNRRMMLDRLNHAMSVSKRAGRYGAMIFLDLDNFKPLNDAYGHAAGDLLLQEAAARLTSCVREIDIVSRFGGDEFAVLISELATDQVESTTQAGSIAEKIRIKLAEPYRLVLRHEGDRDSVSEADTTIEHRCTASIGVVVFLGHAYSQEQILRLADVAMYQAKENGRNSVRFCQLPTRLAAKP